MDYFQLTQRGMTPSSIPGANTSGAFYADKAAPGAPGAVMWNGQWFNSQAAADAARQGAAQQNYNEQFDNQGNYLGRAPTAATGSTYTPTGGPMSADQFLASYGPAVAGNPAVSWGNPSVPGGVSNRSGTAAPGTLGGLASGQMGNAGGFPAPTGNTSDIAMSSFINPMAQYMQDWANKGLQSSYAGAGNFLSGPAAQAIAQFNQNAALNNAWQPAFQNYLANNQQQYNMALNDQTIPFQQQLQLAQLGLQGQQGAAGLQQTLAALLSSNLSNLGQIQGTGTIGGNNAITGAISQWLQQMLSQGMLNRVLPQGQ